MALKMAFNGFSNGFSTNIEYSVFENLIFEPKTDYVIAIT